MSEFLSSLFERHFGLASTLTILASVVFVIAVWHLALMWHRFKSLPCEQNSKRIAANDSNTLNIRESITSIDSRVARIEGRIDTMISLMTSHAIAAVIPDEDDNFSQKHSPRTLNSNGIRIFDIINGDTFLSDNKDTLFKTINNLCPKTPLDVENMAMLALNMHRMDDSFNCLKNWVYNAPAMEIEDKNGGTKTKEITFDDVLFILSIPLRDMYLNAHQELSIG